MIRIKEEPHEVEVRYREAKSESESSENYYQYESIRDQVQAAWCIDQLEVKPKVERIEIDPNRQPVIRLDSDFLRLNFRSKWIELVTSTFRRPHMKKACQLCEMIIEFDSASKLVEHYAEFHQKEVTSYQCTLCEFSGRQTKELLDHWAEKHKRHHRSKNKYTETKNTNMRNNSWIGDDEFVHSFFVSEQQSDNKKQSKNSGLEKFECVNDNVRIGLQRSKQSTHKSERKFECKFCLKIFNLKNSMRKHEILVHKIALNDGQFECDYCHKRIKYKKTLVLHMKFHIKYKAFTSETCGKPFKCKFCSKRFSISGSLKVHEFKMHLKGTLPKDDPREIRYAYNKEIIKCDICSIKVKRFSMSAHKKLFHGDSNKFECDICSEKYPSKYHLRYHIISRHVKEKPFQCEYCSKGFPRVSDLNSHKYTHLKNILPKDDPRIKRLRSLNVECEICSKLVQKLNMKRHMKIHDSRRTKYECNICNKLFVEQSCLDGHMNTHMEKSKRKKFDCKFCSKQFLGAIHLRLHEQSHNKDPFECDICGNTYDYLHSLKKHILKTHIKVRRFKCSFCSQNLKTKSALIRHEMKHRKEYLYKCQFCNLKTMHKRNLYAHIRFVHFDLLRQQDKLNGGLNDLFQGIRTYECYRCKYSSHCKEHVKNHTGKCRIGSKFLNCPNCTQKFCSINKLQSHIKRKH